MRHGLNLPYIGAIIHGKAKAMLDNQVKIPPDPSFHAAAEEAIGRLRYLYPKVTFELHADHIAFQDQDDDGALRRDVAYAVYRAKIASDGRPFRELLHRAVLIQ